MSSARGHVPVRHAIETAGEGRRRGFGLAAAWLRLEPRARVQCGLLTALGIWRVLSYHEREKAHPELAYTISRWPCPDGRGVEVHPQVDWVCDPSD